MEKLKVFDVVLQDDDIGFQAVSFVDEPAILKDFVYFNKTNTPVMMQVADKQEVVSPILIPNQLIFRKNEQTGEQFYIRWSEDTIDEIAVRFMLSGLHNNTTIMHPTFYDNSLALEDCLVEDVYLKRLWIIDDNKTDEANTKYGFDLPVGTLMVHYKIHNNQLWQRIKKGELKGMSVEAFVSMKPVNLNKK